MNFDTVCPNCGAPSAPGVGVCPYCKAVLTTKGTKASPTLTKIKNFFKEGKIDKALSLAKIAEDGKPKLLENSNFVLVYVKILLEVDAPSSKIRKLLSQASLKHPNNQEIYDYLEIIEAKSNLSHEKNDAGEQALANIIKRSPKNPHAFFVLGSHLFWVEKDTKRSLKYLEQCIGYRPNFFKANSCLAALYKRLGLDGQAAKVFRKCASLTSDPRMKKYFRKLATSKR